MPSWTEQEEKILTLCWGHFPIKEISNRLEHKHSIRAIRAKAQRLGFRRPDSYYTSIRKLAKITGYDRKTIRALARKMNLCIQKAPGTRNSFGVTDEQADLIIEALKHMDTPDRIDNRIYEISSEKQGTFKVIKNIRGSWGTAGRPKACVQCGSNEHPFEAKGFCIKCYRRKKYIRNKSVSDWNNRNYRNQKGSTGTKRVPQEPKRN